MTRTLLAVVATTCAFLSGLAAAQEPPEAVYRKFHDAMIKGNIAELRKWGAAKVGEDIASASQDELKAMVEFFGGMMPNTYTVTGKVISPDGMKANLHLNANVEDEGKVKKLPANISMVREGGAWKVLMTEWGGDQPSDAAAKAAAADTSPAQPARHSSPR